MELPGGIEINDDKFEKLSKKEKDKYILELLDRVSTPICFSSMKKFLSHKKTFTTIAYENEQTE